jgi:hypothetical protein
VATVYLDEPFGGGDLAQLVSKGGPVGLTGELASSHHQQADDPLQLSFAARWLA